MRLKRGESSAVRSFADPCADFVARAVPALSLVATVLSLGVVPPFYVVIKNLEARWFREAKQETSA